FNVHYGPTHVSALDSPSPLKLARIHKHLKKINKPAVKSMERDGDIIDCIPIDKQPALDHPLLKDHKIQMPIFQTDGEDQPKNYTVMRRDLQEYWRQVEHCPDGTVPIRRTTVEDVLRAKSLSHFGKKKKPNMPFVGNPNYKQSKINNQGHEYAVVYASDSNPQYYGARAIINLWDPYVQVSPEFSLSQLWVIAGSFQGSDLNTIEVGWQLEMEYIDHKSDGYNKTGCYNLLCSGFGLLPQYQHTIDGDQFEITLTVWKDPKTGDWWLGWGSNTVTVGYWPSKLYTHLSAYSTFVEYGGEIVDARANGQHTQTQMGSGHFPAEGYRKASYFRNVELVNSANTLYSPPSLSPLVTDANCYDIAIACTITQLNIIKGGIMSPSPPPTAFLVLLLLVFVAVVCKETTHASALNAATSMGVSPQKMERIQRYLEKINKPAVKSIKSPDGDIIDCVLMNKQLALDHPLLKNHKIQRPASRSKAGNQRPRNGTTRMAWQAWNHVGNCPEGTVSVRRTTVEDVLRAGSLSRFGKKKVHERIIWLSAGSYERKDLNTIEVGWQDASTGNWWLSYDNIDVGYWPAAIFTQLVSYATSVQWGGEIMNHRGNGQRTTTQMGSGHFPQEGYRKASYFRNVKVVNSANTLIPPQSVSTIVDYPNCYDIQTFSNASWGFYFFYVWEGNERSDDEGWDSSSSQ
ncbi:hypothetical protein ACMD2_09852, partial [Ananas comosus]